MSAIQDFTVAVYIKTQSPCVKCDMTMKKLDREGVEYTTRSLEELPARLLEAFKNAGHLSAPIIQAASGTVSDFRPEFITALGDMKRQADTAAACAA